MSEKTYIFRVVDNDISSSPHLSTYMLYRNKDGLMTPAQEFNSTIDLFDSNNLIPSLKKNNISSLFSYEPRDPETLCSAPYEISRDEDFEACQADGIWHRFDHYQVFEDNEDFKSNGIEITIIDDKDVSDLESKLTLHS